MCARTAIGGEEAAIEETLALSPWSFYSASWSLFSRVAERLLAPRQREMAFNAALANRPGGWVDGEGNPASTPSYLVNAAIHEAALGRSREARAHWDSVRAVEENVRDEGGTPDTYRLTLAYLGLGERDAALETMRDETELAAEGRCREWPDWCTLLARVYDHFGEHDAAIDLLEELLPAPSWLTVHILEVDPIWEPLRDHPRFQALLDRYADDVEH